MIFKKKPEEPEPSAEYSYSVYPHNIHDGIHDFDGIQVSFEKPGWQWAIYEVTPRFHIVAWGDGEGYATRDAALVDLLKEVRGLNEADSNSE